MARSVDHRQQWRRIIGIDRRGAPLSTLLGRPLPDPTQLLDEDFQEAEREMSQKAQQQPSSVPTKN